MGKINCSAAHRTLYGAEEKHFKIFPKVKIKQGEKECIQNTGVERSPRNPEVGGSVLTPVQVSLGKTLAPGGHPSLTHHYLIISKHSLNVWQFVDTVVGLC